MTQDELKARLHYDPETGVFTWLHNPNGRPQWNAVFPGKVAGTEHGKGYIHIKVNDKTYQAHRLAFLYHHGYLPFQVDHIDGNPHNNAISNLRAVDASGNAQNRRKGIRNTSGVVGVTWAKHSQSWLAAIKVRGEFIYGGHHKDKRDAVKARKELEAKYGFHENHGK